jgi:hypothetical protein
MKPSDAGTLSDVRTAKAEQAGIKDYLSGMALPLLLAKHGITRKV